MLDVAVRIPTDYLWTKSYSKSYKIQAYNLGEVVSACCIVIYNDDYDVGLPTENPCVAGSIPALSTLINLCFARAYVVYGF